MDISNKISRKEVENAKTDRERLTNPAEVVEGMGDDDLFPEDDIFGSGARGSNPLDMGGDPFASSGGGFDPFGGGGGGFDPFGGGGGGAFDPFGMNQSMGGASPQQQQPQKQKKELEDVLTDGAVTVTKGLLEFTKALLSDLKHFDAEKGADMFRIGSIVGAVLAIVGFILYFFNPGMMEISALGLLTLGISLPSFVACYSIVSADGYEPKERDMGQEPQPEFDPMGGMAMPDAFNDDPFPEPDSSPFDMDGENDDPFAEENPFDEEDPFAEENPFDDTEVWDDIPQDVTETVADEQDTILGATERVLAVLDEKQIMTRQAIFDIMVNTMPSYAKEYAEAKVVDSYSEEFSSWDAVVKKTAAVFRPSNGEDKDMPHLIRLEQKLFYYYLVVSRSPWIKKIEPYVDELVRYVAVDEDTGKRNPNIVGEGEISGDSMYIRIMQPSDKVIGLKDVMLAERDFFLDPKNEKPVILGVTEEGQALVTDFKTVNSMLLAGMPRSGKTVEAEAIFTCLTMFISPKDMHIYVLDPKEGISDFLSFDVPHVRRFESDNLRIVKTLEELAFKIGAERKALFKQAGVIKYQDYNKKNPHNKVPVIYVIVDEVLSLVETMDDKTEKAFQSLLSVIVSQLPALGIHLIMIPHVIKDSIISKTTSDLITCRMSVRGTPEHIERCIGVKPAQFKKRLVNVGDIAINMGTGTAVYVKGVLSALEAEDRQEIMRFVRDFWLKLEPESYQGSYYQQRVLKGECPPPLEALNLPTTPINYMASAKQAASGVQGNSPVVRKDIHESEVTDSTIATVGVASGKVLDESEIDKLLAEESDDFINSFL